MKINVEINGVPGEMQVEQKRGVTKEAIKLLGANENTERYLIAGKEAKVSKKSGSEDLGNQTSEWVEYWLDGKIIHRSASIHLRPVAAESDVARF